MDEFELAMKFLTNHDYPVAFKIFKDLSQNVNLDNVLRANSYNMMGAIISGFAPDLSDDEDDTGLDFYKKAIELDPDNLGALLNIADGYGNYPSQHHDKEAFYLSCKKLLGPLRNQLSNEIIINLEKK